MCSHFNKTSSAVGLPMNMYTVKLPQRVALVSPHLATQWNSHNLIHFGLLLSKDKCGPTKGNKIVLNADQMDKIMEIFG